MTLENDPAHSTPEPDARQPWTRPTMHCRSASQAELLSGSLPDGVGDQLS